MSFLAGTGPRWFNIPAHRPFIDDLALGLFQDLGGTADPAALSDAVILVPSRRTARALAEGFVRAASGKAVLLPQIRALGDLDEGEPPFEPGDLVLDLPPAISVQRRRFELAGLVAQHQDVLGRSLDAKGALELADALAAVFDSGRIEEAQGFDRLADLAPEHLAAHWRISADVLAIVAEAWPARLLELGLMDLTERRIALLNRLAVQWTQSPPTGVMVAAGSTGSAPATARLLKAIAGLPQGCVVLPGLDEGLSDAAWAEVGDDHPQGALKRLLETAGMVRNQVAFWRPEALDAAGRWRRRVVNEALRPPESTADWRKQIDQLRAEAGDVDPIAAGLEGLTVIGARNEGEAADAIALMMRETLATPGATCALITPDQVLARRVSARLTRWGVVADSSAGAPLAACPTAMLAQLLAETVADPASPVLLLSLLKHPFARLGAAGGDEAARAELEAIGLRGVRPPGHDVLAARLSGAPDALSLFARLRAALEIATAGYTGGLATPAEAARALAAGMEALAAGADGDPGPLWAGAAGEACAAILAALIEESEGLPEATPAGFAQLIAGLFARETVRATPNAHPRLQILGALEGRLIRADRLILAGLEEGVWPQIPPVDPFLSRPMRQAVGLPSPERRIGLSAHDFAQAACAAQVVLVHTERRGDSPAVRSRWLWRLETLARGAGLSLPGRPEVLVMARGLDAPGAYAAAPRPRPKPPVHLRPRKLSVTRIERWVRDPYALYAERILRLKPLDPPDLEIGPRERGTAIHKAFEHFAAEAIGDSTADQFLELLLEELEKAGMPLARMARERALGSNVAPWVVDFERRRRPGAELLVEASGELTFDGPAGPFTVTAKADRIELAAACGHVLDFKTGAPPSKKQVEAGLSPQLTLTAAILNAGGFAKAGVRAPGDLVYVRISGGRTPGEEKACALEGESLDMALAALEGLKRRVAAFDDVDTAYVAWAAPQFIDKHGGDYDHLSRLWEWHVIGEGEASEGAE